MSAWRGIEEFLAVVAAGSFTAAADQLGVSKSYVSKTVNELEGRVGTQLLTRSTRRLALTAAGELFHEHCRRMQDGLIDVERRLTQFRSEPIGRLRVGLSDIFGSDYMSSVLADFSAQHPDLVIEPIAYLRETDVVQENYDVVIRYGNLADSSLKAKLFGYLSYCLCAAPDYLRKHDWPASPDDFARHDCLVDPSGTFHFNDGLRARVRGKWVSNSGVALRWAARRGLGLAHLPVNVIRNELLEGKLLACHEPWTFHDKEAWVVFSAGLMPAATRAFVDFLATRFQHDKVRPWSTEQLARGPADFGAK
ncbi:MAG: LysR family transcriptional regulator [Rudaea sp.]|uniref:LysR family transcriptional regulator n=1 Tax=Rudaea sp. TaxID=2136325 RepID=UPI0039E3994F